MLRSSGKHPFFDPAIDTNDTFMAKIANPKWKPIDNVTKYIDLHITELLSQILDILRNF